MNDPKKVPTLAWLILQLLLRYRPWHRIEQIHYHRAKVDNLEVHRKTSDSATHIRQYTIGRNGRRLSPPSDQQMAELQTRMESAR